MKTLRNLIPVLMCGLMLTICLPLRVSAATVDWSWDYGTEEPTFYLLTSASSFDINVKITNHDTSDRAVYLAQYDIPAGYYYEGFYEFQSNADIVGNTVIQPGETSFLQIGTWSPVFDGPAPYVNIQAQPKYLEVYYYDDNGDLFTSGRESENPLSLKIFDAFDPRPYDDYNPGQGVIIYWTNTFGPDSPHTLPIPSSLWLVGSGLLILTYRRKRMKR